MSEHAWSAVQYRPFTFDVHQVQLLGCPWAQSIQHHCTLPLSTPLP